jgi:dTMP kinase
VNETGFFIVFEGPEGSGKSTQARLLADRIRTSGREVVLTREPGGTTIGEQVRAILLSGVDGTNCAMLPETEALLYTAARAQNVGETIRPALERGAVVICDRFTDSTLAYQGGGRGLSIDDLAGMQRLATGGITPALRILIDLPVEVGLQRRFAGSDQVNRIDRAGVEFHRRVQATYRLLAAQDPAGWVVLDGEAPIQVVAEQVAEVVAQRMNMAMETVA